jgi:ABC-2 type transport system ATP-binding protein
VDSLDLDVRAGDVFGFLGPNGAGKSTTLRMMVGLIRPTSGSVTLFGHDIWRDRTRALRKVGVMIESPAFYKYLSGRDNLYMLANTGGHASAKEVTEALDTVGLLDRAGDKVKSYSQGMRQRLGIALAIIGKPELVLLDEPTNGLDPQGMKEVRDLIRTLSADHGITVFLV